MCKNMSFLQHLDPYFVQYERNDPRRGRHFWLLHDADSVTVYMSLIPRGWCAVQDTDVCKLKSCSGSSKKETAGYEDGVHVYDTEVANYVHTCDSNLKDFTSRRIYSKVDVVELKEQKSRNEEGTGHTGNSPPKDAFREIDVSAAPTGSVLCMRTSFLTKMTDCSWGQTCHPEARIMAVSLKREGFEEILKLYADDVKSNKQTGDVFIQWVPVTPLTGELPQRLALRIGIRGDVLRRFNKEWILKYTDISKFVQYQRMLIERKDFGCIWTPKERVYIPDSPEVCSILGITNEVPVSSLSPPRVSFSSGYPSREIILYLYGAFNPIHLGHVKTLVRGRYWLERTVNCRVCVTGIALMPDKTLLGKVTNPSDMCIKFGHRRKLCEIACSDYPWIDVCPVPVNGQLHYGEYVRKKLNKPDATLGLIMGSDHASLSACFDSLKKYNIVILCFGRKGIKESDRKSFEEAKKTNLKELREFNIVPTEFNDINSTAIRKKLLQILTGNGESTENIPNEVEIMDEMTDVGWITKAEGEYILRHFMDLQAPREEQVHVTCREVQSMRRLSRLEQTY